MFSVSQAVIFVIQNKRTMNNETQKIEPSVMTVYQPGAILEDSWGYEQTNIDFYCIVKRVGNWITVLPMKKEVLSAHGFMTYKSAPTEIDWSEKPKRKRLSGETGFSLRPGMSGGWVTLWKGQPSLETHYA